MRSMLSTAWESKQSATKRGGAERCARRVVGQVEEEGDTVERSILLEVLTEEAGRLHVDSHGGKDDGEVVLVAVVNALGRRRFGVALGRLLVHESGLTTDLRGNLRGEVRVSTIREE